LHVIQLILSMGNYVISLEQRVTDYSERNKEIAYFRGKMRRVT